MKKILPLNSEWTFCKEGVKETVNLPHTWNGIDVREVLTAHTTEVPAPTQRFYLNMRARPILSSRAQTVSAP